MTSVKNKSAIKDFTKGNLMPHLVRFAIPLLLANLMMVLLNTVDMIVVGNELGENGTSAVSIGGSVAMFINAFINGFCAAAQVLIARMVGSGEKKRISRFVSTVCGFIFVCGIAFMAIMLPLAKTMLNLLNTPAQAYEGAYGYSVICLFGIIPIFAYHVISSVVRGMGDSKHPFVFIAIACGLNILLDILFVSVFDWGVEGAAIATVLAQLVSVVFSIGLLIRRRKEFEFSMTMRDFVYWSKGDLSDFIRLAIPMALNNSAIQISAMVVNAMTNNFGVSVSAFAGITATINTTLNLILSAITTAGAMIIGQNLAAGKIKRVKRSLFNVGTLTLSITALFLLAFLIFPIPLFRIFTKEESVLAIVDSYLPILALNFTTVGFLTITRALINGSGNRKINLLNALLDAVVARISFAYIFGILLGWDYLGFWFGSALASTVPLVIGIVFYFSGKWKKSIIVKTEEE